MTQLALDNVTIRYGQVAAVREVSLGVDSGEAVALIGANGAGKTTILRAIAGAEPVAEGTIEFDGHGLAGQSLEAIAESGIALVPEGRRIFGSLTVGENLRLGMLGRKDDTAEDLERMLELFPILGERLGGWAGGLSGGEQQQLAIARALLSRPKLLLLDEPSLGLAPQVVDQIFEVLTRLHAEGQTMLLVEQNAVQALEFADRTYVMRRGRVARELSRGESGGMATVTDLYMGFEAD
jgi:branched-chain amino acid transport system ATP-binding protein